MRPCESKREDLTRPMGPHGPKRSKKTKRSQKTMTRLTVWTRRNDHDRQLSAGFRGKSLSLPADLLRC